jgi:hypothetical protein
LILFFMKSPILFVSIWVSTAAIAFWLGTWFSNKDTASIQVSERQTASDSQVLGDGDSLNSSNIAPSGLAIEAESSISSAAENSAQTEEVIAFPPNLRRAIKGSGLVERLGAYLDAVRAMDAGNAKLVIAAFEALPTGYGRHLEMKLLMRSWATFDPVEALAYANEKLDAKSERRFAVAEALAEWASLDSQAAFEWAKNNNDNQTGDNPLLAGVIKGVAEKDLAAATAMFFDLPNGNARWQASNHLVQKYVELGVDEAIAWADQIPRDEQNFREVLLGQIGSQIARKDPGRAAEWSDTMEAGDGRNRIINTVLGQWVGKDAKAAADWSAKIEDIGTRQHAMTQLTNYWAVRDPVATAQWLNGFPRSTEMDSVVGTFVSRISGRDPAGAVDWARSIVDQKKQDTALRQALTAWRRIDKVAAENWTNTNAPHLK